MKDDASVDSGDEEGKICLYILTHKMLISFAKFMSSYKFLLNVAMIALFCKHFCRVYMIEIINICKQN